MTKDRPKPKARIKRMPREVRERQMVDAAVEVFARRGYRTASMDEIAELAGASKPLVYLYLNSKEDLFSACIRREAEALITAVRAAVDPAAPADRRLWNGLRAFFAHTAAHPDGWAVLHCQARSHGEPFALEVAALRQRLVDVVTQLIADTARDGGCTAPLPGEEVTGLAHALVGAAESLAGWSNGLTGSGRSDREAAETLMNLAWAGLGNLANGRRWAPARS
ncbi:TetR/AcrR family transcriptional regulator [Streptomyces sp. HU2014]|uniref:TetR family transcriptional regulator n=1 Tax=Streptomyces albireticuli TaxID=1940 RepID=A0A1Z2L4Z4_9ACTN|nr:MULTISPECIES: TetR/AcrR family transcriptional regulator [Streptomyces]ARZ69365.1 TetR family transcriptional regulator [Streptomyces albireticuli]UQI43008.1 TetR/AcrR family transcriptional regulator [Streptomyces sp. HU2014]